MNLNNTTALVLAAGKGTRMASALPKVLHPVAGLPLLYYPLSTLKSLEIDDIRVIVGHGRNLVEKVVQSLGATSHIQEQQLGTADAVRAAKLESAKDFVLIINGDHPLIHSDDLKSLYSEFVESQADIAMLTTVLEEPGNYGRIIRQGDQVRAIVEASHASSETLKINEVNPGIYLVKKNILNEFLNSVDINPEKNEYYLTDLIEYSNEKSYKLVGIQGNPRVNFGINTQAQLAKASKNVFMSKAQKLMEEGVVIVDPNATYIEPTVKVGAGSVLHPNVYIRGNTVIGNFCSVEPGVNIMNSVIADSVEIKAGTYIESAKIGRNVNLGPYARIRPETSIEEEAKIGNFVELKKTHFGKGSKAGHLSYLGDAEIGENVNIGCGTITCNYSADRKKHKTKIGDDVFVGSDTQFVAPIEVGDRAIIGSGSTITKNIPEEALAIARGKQVNKEGLANKYSNK